MSNELILFVLIIIIMTIIFVALIKHIAYQIESKIEKQIVLEKIKNLERQAAGKKMCVEILSNIKNAETVDVIETIILDLFYDDNNLSSADRLSLYHLCKQKKNLLKQK